MATELPTVEASPMETNAEEAHEIHPPMPKRKRDKPRKPANRLTKSSGSSISRSAYKPELGHTVWYLERDAKTLKDERPFRLEVKGEGGWWVATPIGTNERERIRGRFKQLTEQEQEDVRMKNLATQHGMKNLAA